MSKKEKEKPLCPVCVNHFTNIIRQPIVCAFCPYSACRQCVSQFLLTTQNEPHCMECKREWNREFIDTRLTQSFRKGPLKLHRRKVLMDRERGRLPAMQAFVEAHISIKATTEKIYQLRIQRKNLKKQRNQIQIEHASKGFDALAEELAPIVKELAEKKLQIYKLNQTIWAAQAILTGKEKAEVKQFIMKCPGEECRGFLSSAWKCGTCQKFFCADCHSEKNGMRDETHTCNEEAKATASMIRQETKPCPKCGIRISKIDGCFAKDTPILLWNGHYSNAQDIKVGDVLVGDDGEPRVVEELCSGGDEMFEVTQGKGMTYIVNSKHKLALKVSYDKLSNTDVIEMTVADYTSLPKKIKNMMVGFKFEGSHLHHEKKPVDELRTSISVKSVGQGTYYGWSVSGTNRRFLLVDFTVVRNCDQMWCTECHTTFSWNSGQILLNTVVHNPHYYEYLRKTNGGAIPREAGDVPCGGLPNMYHFVQRVNGSLSPLSQKTKNEIITIYRGIWDIHDRLTNYPLRQNANINRDIDVAYLMNDITEEVWGLKLEQAETKFERKKEIGLILQTIVHVGSEKMTIIQNTPYSQIVATTEKIMQELEDLRKYMNQSLLEKGVQMGIVVPLIGPFFQYALSTRKEIKEAKEAKKENTIVYPSGSQDETQSEPEKETPLLREEVPETNTVMIEIDGELVEMSRQLAQELMR